MFLPVPGALRRLTPLLCIVTLSFIALPAHAQIVFNEVLQNPSVVSDSNGEWFELYNAGAADVDINGWRISDNDIDTHVIANGGPLLVPAGGYLLLGNNVDMATNGGANVAYSYGGSFFLSNGADELVLTDATGTEIDRIEWDGGSQWPDPTGASMALENPALDNNAGGNWCESPNSFGDGDRGTPGAANDCPQTLPVIVINEILQNPSAVSDANGEWFELFNAGSDAVDLAGWTIKDEGSDSFGVVGSLVIPAAGYLVLGTNGDTASNGGVTVDYVYGGGFFLSNGADELVLYDASLNEIDRVEWDGGPGFPDPNGASMSLVNPALDNNSGANWCEASTAFGDGDNGTPGAANDCSGVESAALVFNEVMQNPSVVGDSAGEWFELYNPGTEAVDIEGWTIRDNDSDLHVISSGGALLVPAEGYLVLGNNTDGATNGGAPVAYDYGSFFLSNGADELVLLDTSLAEIDRIEWDGGATWPDPNGASMALSDPALDNNDGANWCEGSTPFGSGDLGTPGAVNDCGTPPGGEFGVCGDPATPIHDIQGSGAFSPLANTTQTLEAVVIGDFQAGSELSGYFLQEADAAVDTDSATSEGIFVVDAGLGDVNPGDVVRVRGAVDEFFGLTRIENVTDQVVCGNGSTPTATVVTLPVGMAGGLEQYEGMLVTFPQNLSVTSNFTLARFGEVELAAGGALNVPTNVVDPGPDASALAGLNALSRVQLDDASNVQYPVPVPYLGPEGTLRAGDGVTGLTGVLSYSFGSYEVQPTSPVNFDYLPRPAAPPDVGGLVQVAGFNVLNYFTTIDTGAGTCSPSGTAGCRGADSVFELDRQRAKLVEAIGALDADVVGLIELENGTGDTPLQDLVDGLNAALGAGTYAYVATGDIGDDTIRVGLLYQPSTVTPQGSFAILDDSFDPLFNTDRNRPALAQTFTENLGGSALTVVVNHLKSKGSNCNDQGDPDTGDGQGNCNLTRTAAASVLADWLATDPTASGAAGALIIGDLNAYAQEDPIVALETAGFTDLIEQFVGTGTIDGAYSFSFQGQFGYLDHALADASLLPMITGAGVWHINADEPLGKDYNEENKQPGLVQNDRYRSSDHDAVLVGWLRDSDGDGIDDGNDACAGTVLPDEAATLGLGQNRWADVDGDGVFESSAKNELRRSFTLADTAGCSCAQIIASCGLGKGHSTHGCSNGVMDVWAGKYDAAGQAPLSCSED